MLPHAALESLGFGSYITEVKDVLQECKTVALKRRKASSRLENLGIPEEELLRQQQELFAKVGIMEDHVIHLHSIQADKNAGAARIVPTLECTQRCTSVCWFDLCLLTRQARQQQAEIAQQEWLQMQQAAQQAQIAASSANPAQQANSSQDEDDEEDM